MNKFNLKNFTILDIIKLLNNQELTSFELCKYFLDRIQKIDNKINAFIYLNTNDILKQAEDSDKRRAKKELKSDYDGILISVKDIIMYSGHICTCGSKMLSNYISPYSATVIERLKEKGCIIFGKNNMDEFGVGSSGELSAYGPVVNPWDISRITGGSSSGSAASVSCGETLISLGSDTGGSVRLPAAICGVVGFKPTYGTISRYGLIAHGSSLDCIGILAKNVVDVDYIFNFISGSDVMDSTTIADNITNKQYNYFLYKKDSLNGLKIGILKEFLENLNDIDLNIKKVFYKTIDNLTKLGVEIIEVSIPHFKYSASLYYTISSVEISTNLSRFDCIKYGNINKNFNNLEDFYIQNRTKNFGSEVKKRILLGTHILYNEYLLYLKAKKIRDILIKEMNTIFSLCDLMLLPTNTHLPFKLGGISDVKRFLLEDTINSLANLTGVCAISLPTDIDIDFNLPINMQLIGPFLGDKKLLSISRIIEKNRKIKNFIPKI